MIHLTMENLVGGKILGSKRFFIHGQLPTLNEYTKVSRGNIYASAGMKKKAEELIMWEIRSQLNNWKTDNPVFIVFRWVEKNRKRDHDNVAFAKKFIQDALVKQGVLKGDGWRDVVGFIDLFGIDKENAGVEVLLLEVDYDDR